MRPFHMFWGSCIHGQRVHRDNGPPSEFLTGTLGHALAPFLECSLESVINDRVQLVRVRLDQRQVEHGNLALGRRRIVLLLSLALVGRGGGGVAIPHQPFRALDVLQRLAKVVLPAHPLVALLLDELQGAQPETPVLVGFAEQPNGLALGAETPDRLFVGDVERHAGIRRRGCVCRTLWAWRGGRTRSVG